MLVADLQTALVNLEERAYPKFILNPVYDMEGKPVHYITRISGTTKQMNQQAYDTLSELNKP